MKYKVEVQADDSGTWCGNGLRFDTPEEAAAYAVDLKARWLLVEKYRVVPVEEQDVSRTQADKA